MIVMAIDPGNVDSAYCEIDTETLKPISGKHGKVHNDELMEILGYDEAESIDDVVIEMIASYGMPVGREVFDTCRWIGRFEQVCIQSLLIEPALIYRREEKLHICNDARANDATIRRALIDRFALHDLKNGKGTTKNPDWFYGFKADIWAAYAVGITYVENYLREKQ